MKYLSRMRSTHLPAFKKNSLWFLLWGSALVILGLLAISTAAFFTVVSVIFLGSLLLLTGIILIFDTFGFWWEKWPGFALHLIMGLLYFGIGAMLVVNPVASSISLTLLLGVFYILIGSSRLTYSLALRMPKWGWGAFNGLVSLLLGVLILASWPASGLYIIGLFIGIDLLVCGIAYIMAGMATKSRA